VNDSLTPENLTTLAAALAEGRRATVYLREPNPSLGLPDGTSAKVVSIDGNTVTISPKGVNDELPYEAEELRITRNPATPPAPAKRVAAKRIPPSAPAQPQVPTSAPAPKRPAAAVAPKAPTAPVAPTASTPAASTGSAGLAPSQASRRPKKAPGGISVTIHAGADNDWSVTVTQGAKRPTKAQPVSPESVSRAVRELGDPTARDAVEAVISHAREEAARRVAELSRQLEEARTTLAALEQDV